MSITKQWSQFGYFRVASASPEIVLANPTKNAEAINSLIREAYNAGVDAVLFPELCLTGYTCGDLFLQKTLVQSSMEALGLVTAYTKNKSIFAIIGCVIVIDDRLFNTSACIANGKVIGIVPKTFLPSTGEFYEERWFSSAEDLTQTEITLPFQTDPIPIGVDLLFQNKTRPDLTFGIEICEDLWTNTPPSNNLTLAGANLIFNPSASPEIVGKADYRRSLVANQSARCLCAYAYASSGATESTSDLVYSGHCMLSENGRIIAENERFQFEDSLIMGDIDLQLLRHERLHNSSFSRTGHYAKNYRKITFKTSIGKKSKGELLRERDPYPFVPRDPEHLDKNAEEIFNIQTTGLARRLRHVGCKNVVIGISGGLDSTLALLVTVQAFDRLGYDRKGIEAITMPGLGTTSRTKSNAEKLIDDLGLTKRVISIKAAVKKHFKDIGHPEDLHDVTYENSQARERTQILMDVANQVGGFVVGTGDLSESALGWCTFNGDHMSMYHVNSGVPKTLVQFLIKYVAENEFQQDSQTYTVLLDILNTPISPELLPTDAKGKIAQKTEDTIGPYELHDFFLFHMVRHGYEPNKILFLAENDFEGEYNKKTIKKWLTKFLWRFFNSQYKRNACPDGPKVGSVALSPRGDWRMPSDASVQAWIDSLENYFY